MGDLRPIKKSESDIAVSLEREGRLDFKIGRSFASNGFSRFDIAYRSGDKKKKLVSFMTEPFERGRNKPVTVRMKNEIQNDQTNRL